MSAIVAVVLLTAAAVGLDAWLVWSGRALDILTPAPERVVQSFVGAIAAKRPNPAATHLARELRVDGAARVAALDAELRARHGGYRFEDADAEREGDGAVVRARLRTPRGESLEQVFALARDPETRVWKIVAFSR
jgi:hypothetical protein